MLTSPLFTINSQPKYFSGNVTRNTFLQRASTVGYIGICRDHQLPSKVSNFVPVYPLIVPILAEF